MSDREAALNEVLEYMRQHGHAVIRDVEDRALVFAWLPGTGTAVSYECAGAFLWCCGRPQPGIMDLIWGGIPLTIAASVLDLLVRVGLPGGNAITGPKGHTGETT